MDPAEVWKIIILLSLGSLIITWKTKRLMSLWLTSLFLAILTLPFLYLVNFVSHPLFTTRPFYYLYLPVLLGLATVLHNACKIHVYIHLKLHQIKISIRFFRMLSILFLIYLSIIFIPISKNRLLSSATFHQTVGDEEIAIINWIDHNSNLEDVIFTYHKDIQFWIEKLTHRRAFGIISPTAYESQLLHNLSRLGSMILLGNHVIYGENIKLVDRFPFTFFPTFFILIKIENTYQDILYLDDHDIQLILSTDSSQLSKRYLIDAPKKNISFKRIDEGIKLEYLYSWSDINIIKTVTVSRKGNWFIIEFEANTTSEIRVNRIAFRIVIPNILRVNYNFYSLTNSSLILTENVHGKLLKISLTTVPENLITKIKDMLRTDTQLEICFFVDDIQSFSFKFSFDSLETDEIQYFDAYEFLRTYRIKYIVIGKEHYEEINLLLNSYFDSVFETKNIMILRFLEHEKRMNSTIKVPSDDSKIFN
jgi:hypothetical protein